MQISRFSDYSLRILIFLAVSERRKSSAQVIADSYGISFHHVAKAAQFLAREGYVEASRGRGGGLQLKSPAEEISIGAVLRRTEHGGAPLVECMGHGATGCVIVAACGLMPELARAQEAFFTALDPTTLADVVKKRSGLAAALSIFGDGDSGALVPN